jgi:hypothetical protein
LVDAERAAQFLSVTPRYLLELARKGEFPAHPLGNGTRRIWRFRLSGLATALSGRTTQNPLVYDSEETHLRAHYTSER